MVQIDGTENDRIIVRGAGGMSNREKVVLRGAGDSTRVLEIRHDYYTFEVRVQQRVEIQIVLRYSVRTTNTQHLELICSCLVDQIFNLKLQLTSSKVA